MLCVGECCWWGGVYLRTKTQIHPWQQMAFPAHPCQHLRHQPIDSRPDPCPHISLSSHFSTFVCILGATPTEESSIVWVYYLYYLHHLQTPLAMQVWI